MSENNNQNKSQALDALFWREEILQLMYWMEGENLAKEVPVKNMTSLLNTDMNNLLVHLTKNIRAGLLLSGDDVLTIDSSVSLTPLGKKEGGAIFRNAFEGMQKGGHGECGPDCEFCYHEGEKLEDCVHNCADSRHHH
jgi:hypothetical protein